SVLRRINSVDEAVAPGLAQYADHIEPDIKGVNLNGNSGSDQSATGRNNDGIELVAIIGGCEVKFRHPSGIAERIWDRAERRDIGDEEISRASVGQPHDQSSDAISRVDYILGAVIIEEIVAAAPDYVERIRIRRMAGEIIVNLLANIIDRDCEIATAERERVIDDGAVLCAIFGRGAAKCIIGPAIETVLCDCQAEECFFQLFVPGAEVQICRRRGVAIVGEPIIAVVEGRITARVTESEGV